MVPTVDYFHQRIFEKILFSGDMPSTSALVDCYTVREFQVRYCTVNKVVVDYVAKT